MFRNITYSNRPDRVAQLAEHWASIPEVVDSIPTVAGHIFQARPVWIYTQSNITNIICFYVCVVHFNAQTHRNLTTHQVLKNAEQEKKRAYNDHIIEVENGRFTPLVFGTNGAMDDESKKFHEELALKLSNKRSKNYSSTLNWIRTRLYFSIIRSALLSLRGTRVNFYASVTHSMD